jgi:glycosidase
MSEEIEKSLLDIDFAALTAREYMSSPSAWEDQVLYFLLVDRFSDGNEQGGYRDTNGNPVSSGATPLYRTSETNRIDYQEWLRTGGTWQGGNIKGLKGKLGYLKRLGVTAL